MLRKFVILVAVWLPLCCGQQWFSTAASAIELKASPIAVNLRDVGRAGVDAIYSYADEMVAGFEALDKMVASPHENPFEAQEAFVNECNRVIGIMQSARQTCEAHAGDGGLKPMYVKWFNSQQDAWKYTRENGGKMELMLSLFNQHIDVWENNWVPGLRKKKKAFRELADQLNQEYNEMKKAVQARDIETGTRLYMEYKNTVNAAKTMQISLIDLRDFLEEDLTDLEPKKHYDVRVKEVYANFLGPAIELPVDPIYINSYRKWRDLFLQRYEDMLKAYDAAVEGSESIRKETLFRNQDSPIKGLSYKKIHPTFAQLLVSSGKLFDDMEKLREEEEKRWEKDKERIESIREKCGRDAIRDNRIQAVNAGGGQVEEKNIRLEYARKTGPAAYKALFRKMVVDKDLPFDEMKKMETPEFKEAWRKVEEDALKEAEEKIAEIDESTEAAVGVNVEYEKMCKELLKEAKDIIAENEERRKELGMEPKDLPQIYIDPDMLN